MTERGTYERWWRKDGIATFDDLAFLLRTENRVSVLEALARSSWKRGELQKATGTSRPTLARVLTEFEQRDWVIREGGEYRATLTGTLVADTIRTTFRTFVAVDKLGGIADTVPPDVLPADPEIFADVTITTAEPGAPFRPVNRLLTLVEDSETIRELNPSALGHISTDLLNSQVTSDGTPTVVYEPSVVESLQSNTGWRSDDTRTFEDRGLHVRVHESLPFRLSILDERTVIAGYDSSTGTLNKLLETDSDPVRRWALDIFERYHSAAVPIKEADVVSSESATD
jgi:predicted transcriptional regulator